MCGPHLMLLHEIAHALDEVHEADKEADKEQEKRQHRHHYTHARESLATQGMKQIKRRRLNLHRKRHPEKLRKRELARRVRLSRRRERR